MTPASTCVVRIRFVARQAVGTERSFEASVTQRTDVGHCATKITVSCDDVALDPASGWGVRIYFVARQAVGTERSFEARVTL